MRAKASIRAAILKLGLLKEEQLLTLEAELLSISFLDLDKYLFINEAIVKTVETVGTVPLLPVDRRGSERGRYKVFYFLNIWYVIRV